jgi:hypothetical protein
LYHRIATFFASAAARIEIQLSERESRIARNEALFREVNERVEMRVKTVGDREKLAVLCECADLECRDHILMTRPEYEDAHSDPAQFVVVKGHVVEDVEDVVTGNNRFVVVRKRGIAGEIAEELA